MWVSGELPQFWFIPGEPSCAVNVRPPIGADMAHLWVYNGSMRREEEVFKADASLSKVFPHMVPQGHGLLA